MVNPRQTIEMQGVVVDLLITPSLYKRSLSGKMDLTLHDPDDAAEVWQVYVKHVYLAYLNALDVAAYDGHKGPLKSFELVDFETWAAGEGKERFSQLMRVIVEFKTGKTLEEIAAEKKDKKESKKKAVTCRWWRRGSRAATS